MKRKTTIALIFLSLFLLTNPIVFFGTVKAATNINGIITSDTTWTKAKSPYTLKGPVLVSRGVTLRIEPGAVVNFNGYYIQVNGTLNARGSNADRIFFNGPSAFRAILFTKYSPSWNEQTGVGSIIENALVNATSVAIDIGDTSPKINNNSITGAILTGDSSVTGQPLTEASPLITNNILIGSSYPEVLQIYSSPLVRNNTIKGFIITGGGSARFSLNYIEGSIESNGEHDFIADNTLVGPGSGYGIRTGFTTIERNLITNYYNAIEFWIAGFPTIENNTITNNINGISIPGYDRGSRNPYINGNNFYNNSDYNINLYMHETYPTSNVNASHNWWGTTDVQVISQSIHDYKNNFNLGNVTVIPFLNEPNRKAIPDPNASIPVYDTPSPPTTSPTTSPPITSTPVAEFPSAGNLVIVILGVLTLTFLIPIVLGRKRKKLLF